MKFQNFFKFLFFLFFSYNVYANENIDEKVKKLTLELRCMTCQNQSVYDSDSDYAKDIMKVVEEKKDSLYGTLKVYIKSSEYKPQIDDALKSYRKKINMPGFRSGNVPISLIKNKYGVSIKVEEINKIISKEITTFLEKNRSVKLS